MEVPTRQALQAYQVTKPTLIDRVSGPITGAKDTSATIKPTAEANTVVRLFRPSTEWQLGVHAKRVLSTLWSDTIAPALKSAPDKIDVYLMQAYREWACDAPK